ncbi:MAG: ATP-binding protein [Candidatus Sulfomarinibacteraceae bacterium]
MIQRLLHALILAAAATVTAPVGAADGAGPTPTAATPSTPGRPAGAIASTQETDADLTAGTPAKPAADLEATRSALDARLQSLADQLDAAAPETSEVDEIDRSLVVVLDDVQTRLQEALDRFHEASGNPESDLRWSEVELYGEALSRLARTRKAARSSFTKEYGDALTGLSRLGVEQASREARTAWLATRYHFASRKHTLDEVPKMTRDLFTVGAAFSRLLLVTVVLVTALWVRRRWRGWLERLRTSTFGSLASVAAKRRAQRLFKWCETAGPWTLFLATVAAVGWALGPAADATEVGTLLTLLTVFGCYRLAIDVVAAMFVGTATHYGLVVTEERRSMLLRSVRLVLRIGTFLVLIHLASRALGQGFLGAMITRFAWMVVLSAVLVELFRWRDVMVDTFLKLQPNGRLAATLRTTRTRWYGALLAPVAFVWLAGRAVAVVAREFALGFEQTQKALAFLFRQRVQRQAEKQGYAEGVVEELPEGLATAFAQEPITAGELVVPNFPGLEELHEILSTWRATGARGSYLLTGERGIGKTTWLNQIRRDDLSIQRILLGRRVRGESDLCSRLAELLEVDAGQAPDSRDLGRALCSGPQRVVILDMAQHLFLTSVGGYDAFAAFARLVNRTCNNVFWLCSMSAYAWRHLRAVRPDATVFRTRRHLGGWTEDAISELIRTRSAACGVRFNYADLVVDRLEGVSVSSRLIESAEGYSRLLWDYSDGNPRAALHFFLRSLDPDRGGRVRVRLFKAPDVDLVEDGGQDGLFVLAAIVTHESICLDDLIEVTRFDRSQCFIHLDRLLEVGAITLDEEMYRVSTTWHRAAVRLLRRRNLLPE